MNQDRDQEIKRRFANLRRSDAERARSFGESLRVSPQVARAPLRRRAKPVTLFLAALSTAAIIATVAIKSRGPSANSAIVVAEWRPRSDFLLERATNLLFGEMPLLRTSVLDSILP